MTDAGNTHAIQIRDRIAELQWLKEPTGKALDRALRDLVRHPEFRAGAALLLVIRMVDFHLPPAQIDAIVNTFSLFAKHLDRHVAVVVDSEFHYGTIRTIAAHAEPRGQIMTPFREMGPAEQWLRAQLSDSQILPVPPPMPPEQP